MSEKMREEFEGWASQFFKMDVESWGEYVDSETHWAWLSWQASRAALVVELPANCKGMALTVDELRTMLGEIGVTLK